MKHLVALFLISFAVPALADDAILSVSGSGEVRAAPDMATITMGASAEAATASEALEETSRRTQALLAALSAAGVADADVQTSSLSVRPVWSRPNNGSEQPVISGFAASNDVRITIRDLQNLGSVISTAVADGANTLGGLSFGLQDRSELEDEARRLAVADALRKAGVLADAAGIELGAISQLREGGVAGGPAPVMRMAAEAMSDVPVATGEMTVSARVDVIFEVEG